MHPILTGKYWINNGCGWEDLTLASGSYYTSIDSSVVLKLGIGTGHSFYSRICLFCKGAPWRCNLWKRQFIICLVHLVMFGSQVMNYMLLWSTV